MYKNYFITALRNIWKNKSFAFINIMGLALGLACSLVILLWVNDEYQVDAFHKNDQQLYSVYEKQYRNGEIQAFYGSPGVLADEIKRVIPEVRYATQYAWNRLSTFEANGKILKENGNYAGQDFFKMFSYPILAGNAETALEKPLTIAISKKMAADFFGSPGAAIGKAIRYQDKRELTVTAVFDNVPANSTAQFDYLINWQNFLESNSWAKDWSNNGPLCYLMLKKGTNAKAVDQKIRKFLDNYNKEQTAHSYIHLGIARYSEVYLHSNFDKQGNISGGRIQYVHLFSIVAIFILLIACINFMNLTTARSVKRAKEVGVRKVVGAVRFALVKQFIGEALLTVTVAVIISLLLVMGVLPVFNGFTGKQIHIPFNSLQFWLVIAALLCCTGFISGSYPALYLSSFKPVRVLKGLPKFSGNALYFRKGLVVFQFMLSIVLIVGTIVISRQVNYIQTMHTGFDRENLVYIPLEGELVAKYELFKREALQMPGVKDITRMTDAPTEIDNGTGGVQWDGKDPGADIEFTYGSVGYDFIKTMHMQVLQGRDFSTDFATDSVAYLINEKAWEKIGYKNPVGRSLTFWGKKGTIIGVLKDFHFNSLHVPITPLILKLVKIETFGSVLVRTEAGKTKEALASLGKVCKTLNPKFPFTYQFADDEYAKLYKSEQVVNRLSKYFAFLAIFISCLGLLGLVMFTAEQRTKEFGIRKVLGASPVSLFNLLSKEFIVLVLIALVIASPLAWLFMHNWLQNFAYKINVSWWMFGIAGVVAIAIALITVSFQSLKAALANPVKGLRSE